MFTQRCHDAIIVTWKTRHFRHFTSEHVLSITCYFRDKSDKLVENRDLFHIFFYATS